MSESDEEQQPYEFLGFQDIFNSTFHEVEINIQHAFRDYAEAQGINNIANSQEIASLSTISSPRTNSFRSADEISISVNNLPIYAPRSAPVSPSFYSPITSVRAIRASYESLSAASSLQNINYNIQPTKTKANMTHCCTAML